MSSNKKDRMLARGRNRPVTDLADLIEQSAQWESGTTETPIESVDIDIRTIQPDHIQPRRAMPELLRARWCEGAPIDGILAQWQHDANRELARHDLPIDPAIWLGLGEPGLIPDRANTIPMEPSTRLWLKLLALAGSIRAAGGLEQPITVYEDGQNFRLQVGERRLLAFHVLTYLGYDGFSHIAAIVRDQYDPIRQAAENGARLNLNAISLARQIAVLLKTIHGVDLRPDGGQVTQSWYAEALQLEVTAEQSEAIATIIGLPSRRMFYNYRKLLELPNPVWNWADQFDWPEGKIRGLIRQAKGQSEQLITLAQQEVNREIGGGEDKRPPSLVEKAIQRAERGYKAMALVVEMKDNELAALPDAERDKLVKTARLLLKKLSE